MWCRWKNLPAAAVYSGISASGGALMPGHRALLIAAALLGSFIVSSCAGGATPGTSLTAPTAQITTATAPLSVQVDAICAGREWHITVFVDALEVGVTNPGESGVSRMVTVGEHQLSATSARGTRWGPYPTSVGAAGKLERLGCMPADAL
jgi:hypothetical protein